jgi:hypothetical protein
LDFSFGQPMILRDLETSKEITLDPRVIRKDYHKTVNNFFLDFKRRCREHLIDYHQILTNMPLDRALFDYLEKRSRLK